MTKLREEVTEFHRAFGQVVGEHPAVPDEKTVRLRARLVLEEANEFVQALMPNAIRGLDDIDKLFVRLTYYDLKVDMMKTADALADLDYVVEGSRVAFGIDGEPIAREVHRSNMAKWGAGVDEHGKKCKPEGWQPPDVEGELRKQGWQGP